MTDAPDAQTNRLKPEITEENREFWEAARNEVLVAQKCERCGHVWLPPTSECPRCLSGAYSWLPLSGEGIIYTWTLMQRQYHPAYPPPYNVAVVELDEGVRILTNIVGGDPGGLEIGERVSVTFAEIGDGIKLPQFTKTGGNQRRTCT